MSRNDVTAARPRESGEQTESGYDYYQSFRRACRAFFYKGAPYSDVVANIQKLKKDTEREDNSACFNAAVAVLNARYKVRAT